MLQRTDSGHQRLKQGTNGCLDLRAILFNDLFEDRCRDNKDSGREDDPTISFCEVPVLRVRIEPPDEEDADVDLHVVFDGGKIGRFSFYETHEDNRIGYVNNKDSPQVGRGVHVPEIHHYLFTQIFPSHTTVSSYSWLVREILILTTPVRIRERPPRFCSSHGRASGCYSEIADRKVVGSIPTRIVTSESSNEDLEVRVNMCLLYNVSLLFATRGRYIRSLQLPE